MPIHFTCPHCGSHTEVSEQYAGQAGPCAQCGKTVTIPVLHPGGGHAVPAVRSQGSGSKVFIIVAVVVGLFLCSGIPVALLLPAIQSAREAARRARCTNNLKQIGLAMQNYASVHGRFPPAYTADENGEPMHSWRVLILPYLEHQFLHDQYNFDVPWDDPENLALADMMPEVYRCPSAAESGGNQTSYVVIVGPETVFDGDKSCDLGRIQDGASRTLMVVETAGSGINWLEPRDLDARRMSYQVNDPMGDGIGSDHPGGACVGFCDGSTRFLSDNADRKIVKALTTRDGGEMVEEW